MGNRSSALLSAERHLSLGHLDQARSEFEAALTDGLDAFACHHALAVIAAQQGRWPDALPHLTEAIRLNPDHAQIWFNRGVALKALNQLDDAVASFEMALTIDPRHANACNTLGNSLLALNRLAEARHRYEQAISIQSDHHQALYNLGRLHQQSGRWDDAVQMYQRAVSHCPDFVPAWCNLGTILMDHHQDQDAMACFRQALNLAPDFADAAINLGLLLVRLDQRDEALILAQSLSNQDASPDFPHYSMGLLLAKLGRIDLARHHLQMALDHDPDDDQGAKLVLSGLGFQPMPQRPSDAQIQRLYLERAAQWDHSAAQTHAYRGHVLVVDALCTAPRRSQPALSILDAGCGTGLVGQELRRQSLASKIVRLDGIDLSPAMLDRARTKNLYDHLHQGDLVAYMQSQEGAYDVILSAATLIHFGDLRPVFTAAAHCVRPNGRFIFTLVPGPDDQTEGARISLDHGHAQGGCYLHAPDLVRQWAEQTGWTVGSLAEAVHEFTRGQPVTALVVHLIRI